MPDSPTEETNPEGVSCSGSYTAAVQEIRDHVEEKRHEAEFMLACIADHTGEPEEYEGKISAYDDVLEALDVV